MTRLRILLALALLLPTATASISVAQSAEKSSASADDGRAGRAPEQSGNYADRYAVLAEHNIFLRERGRSTRNNGAATRPSAPTPPEQSYVLTGIVVEAGEHRAYFDDRAKGSVVRMSNGDAIANGRITSIEIDAITYEAPSATPKRVEIGNDLTGVPIVARLADGPTSQPAIDPNNPNLTLEERMKLKRMQGK